MLWLDKAGGRRTVRSTLAGFVSVLVVVALLAAFAGAPGTAAPRPGPQPITLTFAGAVVGEDGLVDPGEYPPIEGGPALVYEVPAGFRLVIDSVWADTSESWIPNQTWPRQGLKVGLWTAYDLGACAHTGWERSYDVPLTTEVTQVFTQDNVPYEGQNRRAGNATGPIFVESGRQIGGSAWAPGGDSQLYVHVVAHGRLEASTATPALPTC